MIWFLGLIIAASPGLIELEEGVGYFFVSNPNNEEVAYVIESELELSSSSGILSAFEERLISVSGGSGNVSVVFSSEEIQPALFLPVIDSTISHFWPGVILFLGFLFILVLGLTIYNW